MIDSVEKRGGVGYQRQLVDVASVLGKKEGIRLDVKCGRRG